MPINVRIRVIVPEKALFDIDRWTRAVDDTLHQKTSPDLQKYFKGTTEGWKKQPEFTSHYFKTSSSIGVQVYTSDSVYGIVNAGSPSHLIRPRQRGGILRFQPGYSSATRPGSLKSGAYRRSGAVLTALQVKHPGFTARSFDVLIAEEYAPQFAADIEATFEGGLP